VSEPRIRVRLAIQTLEWIEDGHVVRRFPVSTAAKGAGERDGSEQTPRGLHRVSEKIGAGAPPGTVFVGREPTGEVCTPERFGGEPERDWITTRILWLDGQEPGRNRGGDRDTRSRHVYIHGTPDEASLGRPASHGCIRMRDADVVWLFDRTQVGSLVEILDSGEREETEREEGATT
jgi:lipoprotein-anchoring transpeptidase ErfK/SrfK